MKIFLTDISDMNDDIMNKGLKLVPAYRKDKIERYRFMEDKERSLAAGLLLNYATKLYSIYMSYAGEIELKTASDDIFNVKLDELVKSYDTSYDYNIEYAGNGKPVYSGLDIHFNLSHAGTCVVCAVSDRAVGIDIERPRKNAIKVAERFFTQAECDWIGDDSLRFARIWTFKEAYAKLTGDGIAGTVSKVEFRHETAANMTSAVNMYISGKKADNIKIYELNIIKQKYVISAMEYIKN